MRVTWDPGKRPDLLQVPDELDSLHLESMRKRHAGADHGFFALEAMVFCYEARYQPPQWLIDWIGDRFTAWLDSPGGSLDKLMKLASPGRGHMSPRNRVELERVRQFDAWTIYVLNTIFHISVDDAAEMVQLRNESQGRSTADANWLAESYRKQFRSAISADDREQALITFESEERRKDFLASFPPPR